MSGSASNKLIFGGLKVQIFDENFQMSENCTNWIFEKWYVKPLTEL